MYPSPENIMVMNAFILWFTIIIGNIAAMKENNIILSILYQGNKLSKDNDRVSLIFVTIISVLTRFDTIKLTAPPIIP